MRVLPILNEAPSVHFEGASPVPYNASCTACSRHKTAPEGRVCIPPAAFSTIDHEERTLFLFGTPQKKATRVDMGVHGDDEVVAKWATENLPPGSMLFDYAVRCAGDASKAATKAQLEKCSQYLVYTLQQLPKLERIVCIGPDAAQMVLGSRIRDGYAYLNHNGKKFLVTAVDYPTHEDENVFDHRDFIASLKIAALSNPVEPVYGNAHVVETKSDAHTVRDILQAAPYYSLDIESAGQQYSPEYRLLSVAFAVPDSDDAWVFPLSKQAPWSSELEEILHPTTGKKPRICMHNGKFDANGLRLHADRLVIDETFHWDSRLSAKLLAPTGPADLATLAAKIGMAGMKDEAKDWRDLNVKKVRKWLSKNSVLDLADQFPELDGLEGLIQNEDVETEAWSYAVIPKDVLYRYNASDALATVRLTKYYKKILDIDENRGPLFHSVVMPAQRAVAEMERNGVPCAAEEVQALDAHLTALEKDLQDKLKACADINWNAAKQVGEYLFGTLGLRCTKRTDGGQPCVDADALESLQDRLGANAPEELKLLLELRKVSKLRGTYAAGLLPHVRPDGKIHGNIMLDGASSGRTSMSGPNLQNQPRPDKRKPLTLRIRALFRAMVGWAIVELDFSQLELRIAAALSGDEVMAEMFKSGADFHLSTAKLIAPIFNVDPETVDKEHYLRTYSKIINFGLLYGKTDKGLAEEMKVTVDVAKTVREAILGRFKNLAVWLKERQKECIETGAVWTEWGGYPARRRALHGVATNDAYMRSHYLNASMNTPIQGSASDYCVASFAGAREFIRKNGMKAQIILSIHDAILFHCPKEEVSALIKGVKAVMEGWYANGVPLVADAKSGPSLGEMKEWKEAV